MATEGLPSSPTSDDRSFAKAVNLAVAKHRRSFAADFRKNFLAGLFVLIPIAFTAWVMHAIFSWLSDLGQPIVASAISSMSVAPGSIVDIERVHRVQRILEVFKDILSFIVVIIAIYLLGWATTKVVGKRMLGGFDQLINRIPLAKGIYGTLKQLLSTFQNKPEGVERVVLIAYPSASVRSVGLVTRTYRDEPTGREMASVYMPIAPFLTSGNVAVVPVDELMSTDWSVDEALKFIASGGSVSPLTTKLLTPIIPDAPMAS
jgi:uncharacterized membrane protein